MRKYNRIKMICFVAWLVSGHAALAQIDPKTLTEEKKKQYLEAFNKSFDGTYGQVVIEGKIVDDQGILLKDVLMSEEGSSFLGITESTAFDEIMKGFFEHEKVNEYVKLEYQTLYVLRLEFSKEGYHSSKKDYAFMKPNADVEIKGNTHYYKNQVFVLRKHKNVTKLRQYEMSFKSSLDGAVDVWNLQEQPIDLTGYVKPKKEMSIKDIHYPAVYINIKNIEHQTKQAEFVIADGLGGGFVIDDNADAPIVVDDRLRGMMEAPESGYVSSVLIPPQSEKRELYFYFKINGRYGRGRLFSAYFDKEGFNARVELHIQPDGTRNLETQ